MIVRTVEGASVDQRQLVIRARGGDHDAFTELVHASVARLETAARLILRDPELARDAVQEALFHSWRDLPSLRDPDRFAGWLHRLTVNACLDLARRRKRRPMEVALTDLHATMFASPPDELGDRELVNDVLRRLDERGRTIIVLHYYLGMPLTDVAATLGIPVGTAKSRLHRALGEMRLGIEPDHASLATPATEGGVR